MNGLSVGAIILHGVILSIGLSVINLAGMYLNPRIMLQDYPKEIQAQVPPQTNAEKRQQAIMGIFFFGFALALIFYSNAQLVARAGQTEFLPIFLNTYLVFEIFNLFDLLVLDYLVMMVLKPKFLFIPGSEHMEQYNTFGFHFRGFLIGLIIGFVASGIISFISVVIL